MANILLIETATDICAVGLGRDSELLAEIVAESPMVHTSKLTLMIEEVLRQTGLATKDLDAVALSRGPGSYTALRVGAATAKGICFGLDLPLIEVDTLGSISLAMANSIRERKEDDRYFPMIDARRMEVYGAVFEANQEKIVEHQATILDRAYLESLIPEGGNLILGGNGAEKCHELTSHPSIIWTDILCAARHLLPLASQAYDNQDFVDVAYFKPYYLKPPNITTPKPMWK